ncbi:hypothetical protein HNV27_26445, partial [Myxococcus xanthus]|nr:hypothetical protein [Myxococcus xanthus]
MTMTAILLVSLTMGLGAAAPAGARAEVTWPAVAPSTVQLRAPGSAAPPSDVSSLLASRCRQWAATPDNPWALAHGLALDGRDFRTRDGQPAADTIIARYLRRTPPPSHS